VVAEGLGELMLIHLITICIGLIIAFGLQQLVEGMRRRIRRAQHAAKATPPGDKQKEL